MALSMSPISRNLHMKVTLMYLELENLLTILLAVSGSMIVGNFLFPNREIFHIPMNYFLPLVILLVGVPGLMLFKYGKPRGICKIWCSGTRSRAPIPALAAKNSSTAPISERTTEPCSQGKHNATESWMSRQSATCSPSGIISITSSSERMARLSPASNCSGR